MSNGSSPGSKARTTTVRSVPTAEAARRHCRAAATSPRGGCKCSQFKSFWGEQEPIAPRKAVGCATRLATGTHSPPCVPIGQGDSSCTAGRRISSRPAVGLGYPSVGRDGSARDLFAPLSGTVVFSNLARAAAIRGFPDARRCPCAADDSRPTAPRCSTHLRVAGCRGRRCSQPRAAGQSGGSALRTQPTPGVRCGRPAIPPYGGDPPADVRHLIKASRPCPFRSAWLRTAAATAPGTTAMGRGTTPTARGTLVWNNEPAGPGRRGGLVEAVGVSRPRRRRPCGPVRRGSRPASSP